MTSRYFDDGRGGAFGHEPLRVRRDHSVVLRDEIPTWLGFPGRHADRVPASASTPQGSCESAVNAALAGCTSAANDSANFLRSRNKNPPSCGGRIGGTGAPGSGSLINAWTDSPASG